jgi:transposase
VATAPKAMREVFGGMPRSRMALETGTHSPWVSRVLSELGHQVIVTHALNVRLIGESRKKDDRLDARMLARLGLVRARTALINTARGVKKFYGEEITSGGIQLLGVVARQQVHLL